MTSDPPENSAEVGIDVQRLVRWDWCCDDGKYHWELSRADGTSAATVWENGSWHTWDQDGVGGENSREDTVSESKIEAMLSAINQGFIEANRELAN